MIGQGSNQHTKNLMLIFSEQITVFESGKKTMLFLILGHPIVPCDSATPGLHKTGFGMFGIKNLT